MKLKRTKAYFVETWGKAASATSSHQRDFVLEVAQVMLEEKIRNQEKALPNARPKSAAKALGTKEAGFPAQTRAGVTV
jgi:hypothetical protein